MKQQTAIIRYRQVVMWDKPGGNHYTTFLNKGDEVTILQGWKFCERTWKDKRYLKVMFKQHIGYVLAESLTTSSVDTKPFDYENDLYKDGEIN